METRQLEHEGFEHTDEFRQPLKREPYQSDDGQVIVAVWDREQAGSAHGGKRWILRKKQDDRHAQKEFEGFRHTGERRKPKFGEWYQPFPPQYDGKPIQARTDWTGGEEYERFILVKDEPLKGGVVKDSIVTLERMLCNLAKVRYGLTADYDHLEYVIKLLKSGA